mmetsp:Transcript_3353/g.11799  ORF Transcript_3353/g.11799 Transcript_3353/m.11799 type:complete len:209 (+) Transcript_3353:244-870(+)
MLPQTYCIKAFCLGHKGFVSGLVSISDAVVASGGVDGTVRLWAAAEGKQLAVANLLPENAEKDAEESDRTVATPLVFDAAHQRILAALGPRLIFLQVSGDADAATLTKVGKVTLGGDVLAAAFDSTGTLLVAVDGLPYIAALAWANDSYAEAESTAAKATAALLRETAVKTGTEKEVSLDRQLRSWNEFVTKGKVVNAHNKRRKTDEE